MPRLALATALLLAAQPTLAGDVSPDQAANVQRDRKAALDDVAKKYEGKTSPEDRRQRIADESAAVAKVLDKHGVSAKDFARYEATAKGSERDAARAKGEELDKKDAAAKAAQDAKAKEAKEAKPEGGIVIEKGLPGSSKASGKEK